jgi:large repetitive protein
VIESRRGAPGGNPVLGGNLSITGPRPSLAYDSHGNTTKLADQTLTYDIADRHMSTTLADGTLLTYQRDATGMVLSRTVDTPTESPVTIKYTGGGGMSMILHGAGTVGSDARIGDT